MSARPGRVLAAVLVGALLPVGSWATGGASTAGAPTAFEVEGAWNVPEGVGWVRDVRWAGPDSLFVARSNEGTSRVELISGQSATSWSTVSIPGQRSSLRQHHHLAYSEGWLAVSAPLFEIVLTDFENPSIQGPIFETIDDVDLHRGRLAVLGSRRDDQGVPEPGIALLFEPEGSTEGRILVRSVESRTGPWPIDSCPAYELGTLRFLPDGSLLVVPGVEPDIYLFDPRGRLVRTWSTDPMRLSRDCPLEGRQAEFLARDQEARWRWLNRRRTVDDAVPLPGGDIGLLVRDPLAGQGVVWELIRLQRDGVVLVGQLPFGGTERSFLRADVRNGRAVVLIGQWWSLDTPVDAAPQLWTGRFAPRP